MGAAPDVELVFTEQQTPGMSRVPSREGDRSLPIPSICYSRNTGAPVVPMRTIPVAPVPTVRMPVIPRGRIPTRRRDGHARRARGPAERKMVTEDLCAFRDNDHLHFVDKSNDNPISRCCTVRLGALQG